jgi:hypothetical protein
MPAILSVRRIVPLPVVFWPPHFQSAAGEPMKTAYALLAALVVAAPLAHAQGMEAMSGKMKEGMYSYKMEMDMGQVPGMPQGMGKQNMAFQHCVTKKDIERGQLGKGRDEKKPQNCEIKDFKMSGSTASYRMVCTGDPAMTADNTITFVSDGFRMNMKMAMDQGGRRMNMTQNMEAKYLGPCK